MRVKWETVAGRRYNGEVINVENEGDGLIADVRLDDGTIKSIDVEYLQEVK